jgi:hypothetical protein
MHTGDTKQSIGYLPATGKEMSLQSAAEEKRLREDNMEATVLSFFGHWLCLHLT